MRDFDQERRERQALTPRETFTIAGREFTVRAAVNPDVFVPWMMMTGDEGMLATLGIVWTAIAECVEERELWEEARAERDPARTIDSDDLLQLLPYLLETVTGRPTGADASSSDGSASTGTTSTEPSSSPEVPDSTGSTPDSSPTSPTPTSTTAPTPPPVPASTASSLTPTAPGASPNEPAAPNGQPPTDSTSSLSATSATP